MTFWEQIIELLLPTYCINCYKFNDGIICKSCQRHIKFISPESFATRNKNSNWEIEPNYQKRLKINKAFYFLEYNELIHKIFMKIKYGSKKAYIKTLMEIVFNCEEFSKVDFSQIKYITYVPMTIKNELKRGFNQSKIIAEILSKKINIPVIDLIKKNKETKNQTGLNRKERLINVKNSFVLNEQNIELNDMSILITDDICTTGSTLTECAKTITKKFKNAKINCFCIARGKL